MKFIAGEVVKENLSLEELKGKLGHAKEPTPWQLREAERRRLEKVLRTEETYLELQGTRMATFSSLYEMLLDMYDPGPTFKGLGATLPSLGRVQELAYDFAYWKYYNQQTWLAQHTEEKVYSAFLFWMIKKIKKDAKGGQ